MMRKLYPFILAMALSAPLSAAAQAANTVTAQVAGEEATVPGRALRLEDAVNEACRRTRPLPAPATWSRRNAQRSPQARALPDPFVGVGWMGNIRPFSVQNCDPSAIAA